MKLHCSAECARMRHRRDPVLDSRSCAIWRCSTAERSRSTGPLWEVCARYCGAGVLRWGLPVCEERGHEVVVRKCWKLVTFQLRQL